MLKKILLNLAIVAISQLSLVQHISAMEKSVDKSRLTEQEKKRLIKNRFFIEEHVKNTQGEQIGKYGSKDIRNVISGTEYALAPKQIKFKCPTAEELNKTEKSDLVYKDANGVVFAPAVGPGVFNIPTIEEAYANKPDGYKYFDEYTEFSEVDVSYDDKGVVKNIRCFCRGNRNHPEFLDIDFKASGIDPSTISFDTEKFKDSDGTLFSMENVEFIAVGK